MTVQPPEESTTTIASVLVPSKTVIVAPGMPVPLTAMAVAVVDVPDGGLVIVGAGGTTITIAAMEGVLVSLLMD